MDQLIDIMNINIARGVSGGQVKTPTSVFHSVWAKREDSNTLNSDNESYEDGQLIAMNTVYYTFWHLDDLTTEMGINDGALEYDIVSIERIGRNAQQRVRAIRRSTD